MRRKAFEVWGEKMKVAAAATYQRPPKSLKRLTEDLNRLTLDTCQICQIPGSEVIVDDDAASLVNASCEEMHSYVKWPRKWPVESRCGIPCALIRVVAHVQEEFVGSTGLIGGNEVLVS